MDATGAGGLFDFLQSLERVRFAPIAAQALAPAFFFVVPSAVPELSHEPTTAHSRSLPHVRCRLLDARNPTGRNAASGARGLLYSAIHSAIGAALAVAAVVLVVFINVYLGATREWGAALVLLLALGLFAHAFICLLREVRVAMVEFRDFERASGAGDKPAE